MSKRFSQDPYKFTTFDKVVGGIEAVAIVFALFVRFYIAQMSDVGKQFEAPKFWPLFYVSAFIALVLGMYLASPFIWRGILVPIRGWWMRKLRVERAFFATVMTVHSVLSTLFVFYLLWNHIYIVSILILLPVGLLSLIGIAAWPVYTLVLLWPVANNPLNHMHDR